MTKLQNLLEKGHAAGVEVPITSHQRERGVGIGTTTETGKGIEREKEMGQNRVRRAGVEREMTAETGTETEIGREGR